MAKPPHSRGEALHFYRRPNLPDFDDYTAEAAVTDAHGTGRLTIMIKRRQTGLNCVDKPSSWQCETQTLPDGTRITSMRYAPDLTDHGAIQWEVELVRPDGSAVLVMCGNWAEGVDKATEAEPPLGRDILVAIAKIPGLIL